MLVMSTKLGISIDEVLITMITATIIILHLLLLSIITNIIFNRHRRRCLLSSPPGYAFGPACGLGFLFASLWNVSSGTYIMTRLFLMQEGRALSRKDLDAAKEHNLAFGPLLSCFKVNG